MADVQMLYCTCGYSCGTKAALSRHIAKFEALDAPGHAVAPAAQSPAQRTKPSPLDLCDAETMTPSVSFASDDPTSPVTPSSPITPFVFSPTACPPMTPHTASLSVRLLLVRHAQSANKCRRAGQRADPDPDLSDLGYEQAEALGERLFREFERTDKGGVLMASSPMRRCLQTIQPAVRKLKLPPEYCACHGACYEFGCAGVLVPGTTPKQIAREFPEFRPVGFNEQGFWDYVGANDKENEPECRARAIRIVQWLLSEADAARTLAQEGGPLRTLVLATHQTVADLLCQIFLQGRADEWKYGEIAHRLQNASITEVHLRPDGRATLGFQNEGSHLIGVRWMR